MNANSNEFPGKKLSRQTSGAICKTLKSELKNYWLQIEAENDNSLIFDAIVHQLQNLRVDVNK